MQQPTEKPLKALLVSLASQTRPTNASMNCFQYQSDPRWSWLGLACKTTLLVRFCESFSQLSCHLGRCVTSFLVIWEVVQLSSVWAVKPFSQFPSNSVSFQEIQPASEQFSQLLNRLVWFLNGTTSLCIIKSRPTSL